MDVGSGPSGGFLQTEFGFSLKNDAGFGVFPGPSANRSRFSGANRLRFAEGAGAWPQGGSARGRCWDAMTARKRGASARRPCARPGEIGRGTEVGATGKAPILIRLPSFDGYSSTFLEPPSRPRSRNVLTCGNADRRPRSTRGFLKSIRISEKPAGAGAHEPVYRVTAGPCPTARRPRLTTDAMIPTKRGPEVSETWRKWLRIVGNVASVADNCWNRDAGGCGAS